MFDWFNKKFSRRTHPDTSVTTDMEKIAGDMGKVVPFPELKTVPSMSKVEPPKAESEAKVFYRIGVTDKNRVSFQMGYSEITMTKLGARNLIDQLELFQGQLRDEEADDDNES